VSVCNTQGRQVLHDVSLSLRAGSVIGVAGLAGSGQEELAGCIAGLMPVCSGRLHRHEPVGDVAYIPADRLGLAAPAELRVIDNITLHDYWKTSTRFQGLLGRHVWRQMAGDRCRQFNVKTPGLHVPTGCLSGGNIQRVIIARELARPASVIVAHNPTAGLDIEGVAFVRRQLLQAVSAGDRAVLLISDDLDELLELSDEIVVLCKGRGHGPFPAAALDRSTIGRLMLVTG
jgi:general nucleoside transport system ATP-binding protein